MDSVREVNGTYIVEDSTNGGYVDRMTYSLVQDWVTVWDKDLNLLTLMLKGKDITEVVVNKDKEHYDYHRAVRTRGRHLRMLKEYLGMETKKTKEKPRQKIIYRERGFRSSLDDIKINVGVVYDKTITLGWTHKKNDLYYTSHTNEKEAIVEEYNERLKAFREYQSRIFKLLFEDSDEEPKDNGYFFE